MAKNDKTTETNLPATLDDMMKVWQEMGLSEEQIAELRAMSGQDNVQSFDALPVFRVNMYYEEDKQGKTVKHGNWVLGQKTEKNDAGEDVLVDCGIDLGEDPEVIFFAAPQQYSKAGDKKTRCNSQLLFNQYDEARGSNYKYACKDKTCPWRAEGLPDNQKCRCQFVSYMSVKVGEEFKPCISYQFRKSCFMGLSDYIKKLGCTPLYMQTTKLPKTRKKNGNVVYYEVLPEKGRTLTAIEFKDATTTAMGLIKGIKEFEKQRATKQLSYNKPSGSTEGLGFDNTAGSSKGANASDAEIVFD